MFPYDYGSEAPETLGTVYVVDDDDAVRDSLKWLLEASDYRVELYDSGESFIAKYDPKAIAVLVLDVRMPGMSGLELQEEMTRRGIDLPILFLSGHGDISMAVSTLKRGAEDFCEKPVEPAKLRESVRRMISKNIAHRREAIDVERKRERFAMLTEREQLVVRLVARDMLNKQIAAELDIQEHTVKIDRSNACRKLEVRSALELHHYLSAIGELAEDQKAPEDRDFTDD